MSADPDDPDAAAPARDPAPDTHALPVAVARPPRRSRLWLLPAAAALLAAALAWQAWGGAGPRIEVQLDDGHGLAAGDALRHRGVVVGEIVASRLVDDATGVLLAVRLQPEAASLARQGSRFWVERPRLELEGLRGLDTLLAGSYLAVQPGAGPPARRFVGLPEAPLDVSREQGVDIVLEAERRGSLRAGSPVTYRRIPVGRVLAVGLASDGRRVEATARVARPYAELVREGTRFWDVSGVQVEVGLGGVDLQMDTLEALLRGGVALAVPPGAGAPARTGQRFALHARPEPEWLRWQPNVALGDSTLPAGAPRPEPLRARLVWTEGLLWSGTEAREGWVLPVVGGVLAPADLAHAPDDADAGSARLELLGAEHPLAQAAARDEDAASARDAASPRPAGDALAVVPLPGVPLPSVWPRERQRVPKLPEDCVVLGDPGQPPLVLAAARLDVRDDGWWLDPGLLPPQRTHGAPVLARHDGRLIGLLLVDDERARLAPLERVVP